MMVSDFPIDDVLVPMVLKPKYKRTPPSPASRHCDNMVENITVVTDTANGVPREIQYSLVHPVRPKINSQMSLGLFKIRLLFQDPVRSQNVRNQWQCSTDHFV